MTLTKGAERDNCAQLNPDETPRGELDPNAQRVLATSRPVNEEGREHYDAARGGEGASR